MNTTKWLALFPLAGLLTAAVAQQEPAGADPSAGVSTSAAGTGRHCDAQVALKYLQWDSVASVEGEITNKTCAASSGSYEIDIRIRDENDELRSLRFQESWRRDDDRPVAFETNYPIGENVLLVRAMTSDVDCTCAEAIGDISSPAISGATESESPSPIFSPSEEGPGRRGRRRATPTTAAAEPELECRSMRITGTRLPKSVCATTEQWAALDARAEEEAQDVLRRSEERSTIYPGPPPSATNGAGF